MGKMKNLLMEWEEIIDSHIQDVYITGDFYSPQSFKAAVFAKCKESEIPTNLISHVSRKVDDTLGEL